MRLKTHILTIFAFVLLSSTTTWAQTPAPASADPKVVVITGNRFSYPLLQKWIDDYNKVRPDVQLVIEARGTSDPAKFQILAEVYTPSEALAGGREYIKIGRYAILPVATSNSAFARYFSDKGLTEELIKQIFFNDIYADKSKQAFIEAPYTVYTRMQKAGVPLVFSKYFGFEQKDIKGTSIAGADEHLVKATLRDPNGVTYLALPLIYDVQTKKPVQGLTVLPVDANGNGKVNDEEKFVTDLDRVVERIEKAEPASLRNIPIEYLYLSVDKTTATTEAIEFLKWVNEHGQSYLHQYGYLLNEAAQAEKEKFDSFASKRQNGSAQK